MRKIAITSVLAIVISVVFLTISYAEMAKEGSGSYGSAKSGSMTVLPMEKERLQANYEEIGIVVEAPENCPLYNASFRDIGTLHAIKGKLTGTGFIEFTTPNNDKVYGTFDVDGMLGKAGGVIKFVGGTGTCTGITGTIEFKPGPPIQSGKEGTYCARSIGKVNWKIP
jgi:hypothetical protein